MPLKSRIAEQKPSTRDRILQAAMLRFAQHSYEETKLRDIAADVGVDVAFVHRSFGSKEQLFAEVINAAFQPEHIFSADRDRLTPLLTERTLEPSLDRVLRLVDPLDIIVRNLLSSEVLPILRAALERDVIGPLGPKLDDKAPQRAALLAAWLAGIGIFRNVLRAEPLLEEADEELKPLIADVIDVILGRARIVPTAPKQKPIRKRKSRTTRKTR